MITESEAKLLVGIAQEWFVGVTIDEHRQRLWAEAISDVAALEPRDVQVALKRIAATEHNTYWRLEIAEILAVAKGEMRRRVEREAQAEGIRRPQLAAVNERKPMTPAYARALRTAYVDLAAKILPDGDVVAEIKRRAEMTMEQLNARRDALNALHRSRERREMVAAAAVVGEREIKQSEAQADARRAELQRQAAELGEEP